MEFMSTYPDGQILILVKQGSLSSLEKTSNQLLFMLEMVAMIFYFWIFIQFNNQVYRFQYMAMADDRRRIMPFPEDRLPGRCQPLAYQEAVLLVNPKDPRLKGEVLVAKPNTSP
jgi:hypothetical protein